MDIVNIIHEGLLSGSAFDLAEALLFKHGTSLHLTVALGVDDTQSFSDVRWTIRSARSSELLVSRQVFALSRAGYIAARLEALLPIIIAYHDAGPPLLGKVNLNVEDYSDSPGLSLCSAHNDAFLIPDTDFVKTKGYAEFRREHDRALPAWTARRPTAFWRGSSTGLIWAVGSWQALPRIRLCEIGKSRPDIIDAGISSVVQIEQHSGEIEAAGLMRAPVPATAWSGYRYQIDIDGNSNAWAGFFQRLLTGSPVLKAESPFGFRQWFYHRLTPWVDYVPIAADLSDLVEKIEWLNAHERMAELIGQQGRRFANAITYDSELPQIVLCIAAAITAAEASRGVVPASNPTEGQSIGI